MRSVCWTSRAPHRTLVRSVSGTRLPDGRFAPIVGQSLSDSDVDEEAEQGDQDSIERVHEETAITPGDADSRTDLLFPIRSWPLIGELLLHGDDPLLVSRLVRPEKSEVTLCLFLVPLELFKGVLWESFV